MPADLVPFPGVVLDRLAALGVDVPRLLRHAGLAPSRFQRPRPKLSVPEFFTFWRALGEVGASRDIALRVGAEARPHQYDAASFAALHSPTLGEAYERLARYKRLVCGESLELHRVDGEARLCFRWVHVQETPPQLLVEASFASLLSLARQGSGTPLVPLRVELARRREGEALLRRHFGCPVRFDAPADLLVLDEAALQRPFTTHNADLLAWMVPGLESALAEALPSRSLAEDVRAALTRHLGGERPSVERVAKELGVSPRTLQRRLEEQGTRYQQLLDEVRRETSRRLLASTDLDASEVAFLLGYEELNSFSRAFTAWEGVSPGRWRKELL